ncbi:hypothetical protein GPECTOR_763g930 [Gonium pectorale]|uniref:Uncharacterized protein n=1 Tax=Gonium pectorale TaxID=33097 RepID=A0A150FU31_GONPE|nr:hypothetical protein GPECTOR_763g930 [Gonium pectorale]|eukprot:KXZ41124.1 hypothetical protein GPECTOR_763g930 [Gonium pectorale]
MVLISPFSPNDPLRGSAIFDPSALRPVYGTLVAVHTRMPYCPPASDRDAWLAGAADFAFFAGSSTYGGEPISVPGMHVGRTGMSGNAGTPVLDFNMTNLALTLASGASVLSSYGSNDEIDSWAYDIAWSSRLASGTLMSQNSFTGRRTDSIAGWTAESERVAASVDIRTVGGRPQLFMLVPRLELLYDMVAERQLSVFGVPYSGTARFNLALRLVATRRDLRLRLRMGGGRGRLLYGAHRRCQLRYAVTSTAVASATSLAVTTAAIAAGRRRAAPAATFAAAATSTFASASAATFASAATAAFAPTANRVVTSAATTTPASVAASTLAATTTTPLATAAAGPPDQTIPRNASSLLRLSLAMEGVDPVALNASAAAKDALASAVIGIVAAAADGRGGGAAARVLSGALIRVDSVASVPSADGAAAVVSMRLLAAATADAAAAAAAQVAFDALQTATLNLRLQRAIRAAGDGVRRSPLAKAQVRALSGQLAAAL